MKIRATLRNINKTTSVGTINILIDFMVNGKRKQKFINTNIYVETNHFSKKNGIVLKNNPYYKEYNSIIENRIIQVLNIKKSLEAQGFEFTPDSYEKEVKKNSDKGKELTTLIKEYIDSQVNWTTKNREKYKNLLTRIIDFQEGKALYIENLNQNWINHFVHYLGKERPDHPNKYLRKSQAKSTIHKTLTFLKTILIALSKDEKIDTRFTKLDYPKEGQKPDQIILSVEEMSLLKRYNPKTEKLRKTKEFCLIQLFTGLRYSDVVKIRPHHIHNDFLSIMNKKTKIVTNIPLYGELKNVLERNGYSTEKLYIENQPLNRNIKELFKEMGVDQQIYRRSNLNNNETEILVPRYSLIGTHTLRRSFVTFLISKNVSTEIIRQFTGHKSDKQLLAYSHLNPQMVKEASEEINKIFNI